LPPAGASRDPPKILIKARAGVMPMDEDDTIMILKPKRDPRDRRPLIATMHKGDRDSEPT